jgi:transposase
MGHQARRKAFGVHDRLFIDNPNSCWLAFPDGGLLCLLAGKDLVFARMGMMDNTDKLFIGIDVSKATLEVALDQTCKTQVLDNTEAGIAQLVALLKRPDAAVGVVLLEATGGFERECAMALCLADLAVIVVNPRQARDFAKAMGYLSKTDALDAKVLSHFAQTLHDGGGFERRLFKMPTQSQTLLQALVTRRGQLMQMRVAELNRQGTAHKSQHKSLARMIQVLTRQIAVLDEDIGRSLDDHFGPKLALLKDIKGVGVGTQAALMAMLPELGALSAREISKLAGVAPLNCDSGKFKGKRVTWGGRAALRTALYMAALSAMQHEPVIKAFAHKLKAQGKAAKVVIVACMHKLLVIMNAVVRSGTAFSRTYAQEVKYENIAKVA